MAIFPNGGGGSIGGGGGGGGTVTSDNITDAGTTGKAVLISETTDDGLTALDANIATPAEVAAGTARKILDATVVDTDPLMLADSDSVVPSQKALIDYVASQVAGGVTYRGNISVGANMTGNTTGNTYADSITKYLRGDMFVVAGDGNLTFSDGTLAVTNGDAIIFSLDATKPVVPQTSVGHVETSHNVTSVFGREGAVVALNGDYTAGQVTNAPSGTIVATTVQAAINELGTEKVDKSTWTAKGGLVTATAASTPAILPVGLNNHLLMSDSAQLTGLRWTPSLSVTSVTSTIATSNNYQNATGNYFCDDSGAYGIKWTSTGLISGALRAHIFRWVANGNLMVTNNGAGNTTGVYLANGRTNWLSTSDNRVKYDKQPVTGVLGKLANKSVISYLRRETGINNETGLEELTGALKSDRDIGIIAQEWMIDYPEIVNVPDDYNDGTGGFLGVDYSELAAIAIQGLKEANDKLISLEARLTAAGL